jgi:CRISPR system Cascade subunit CasC
MPHICFHVIQSFPPNNLNRDDTGAPKDCVFGGVRRARVSSQAWKRSVRIAFRDDAALDGRRATRTRRLQDQLAQALATYVDAAIATELATATVDALGVGRNSRKPEESAVLVFITDAEVRALADWAREHQEQILAARPQGDPAKAESEGGARKRRKPASADWDVLSAEARNLLHSPQAVDTALFGRMLAEIDGAGIEAAASVAHAISTHAVQMEEDYFTAVDDLKQLSDDVDKGSGMIGEVLFQSAVLYRFATIDPAQLVAGLGDDHDLARAALAAFTRAFLSAIPSGKQTTFAAYNLPSAVLITLDAQPLSLANAFLAPVVPRSDARLDALSWMALTDEWQALAAYTDGTHPIAVAALDTLGDEAVRALPDAPRVTLTELPDRVASVLEAALTSRT